MVAASGHAAILESERLPMDDRILKDSECLRPPLQYLTTERVFGSSKRPNADLLKQYLFEGGRIGKELLMNIMQKAGGLL